MTIFWQHTQLTTEIKAEVCSLLLMTASDIRLVPWGIDRHHPVGRSRITPFGLESCANNKVCTRVIVIHVKA